MQHNFDNVQQELQFAILVTCKGGNLHLRNTVGGFLKLKFFSICKQLEWFTNFLTCTPTIS